MISMIVLCHKYLLIVVAFWVDKLSRFILGNTVEGTQTQEPASVRMEQCYVGDILHFGKALPPLTQDLRTLLPKLLSSLEPNLFLTQFWQDNVQS